MQVFFLQPLFTDDQGRSTSVSKSSADLKFALRKESLHYFTF